MPSALHHNGDALDASTTRAPSLDALLLAPSPVEALARFTPDALAALAGQCAAILCAIAAVQFQHAITPLHANGNANGNAAAPTRMLSADTAAAVLGKPRRWLFDHAKRLPFVRRISRKTLLVDESMMLRWIASRH